MVYVNDIFDFRNSPDCLMPYFNDGRRVNKNSRLIVTERRDWPLTFGWTVIYIAKPCTETGKTEYGWKNEFCFDVRSDLAKEAFVIKKGYFHNIFEPEKTEL